MTATTIERTVTYNGLLPSKGTLGCAANVRILKGTLVAVDANGRATPSIAGDGLAIAGIASSTFRNLTTDESGGAADAINVEIQYGVFEMRLDGTTPTAGDVVFAVDNQTVSIDSSSSTRGLCGYVSEVRTNLQGGVMVSVLMGPTIVGQIVIASAEAAFVDTLQTEMLAQQVDATSAQSLIQIPMTDWRDSSDGGPVPAFATGSADGFSLVDGEAFGLRLNNSIFDSFACNVVLPPDLDSSADIVVHIQAFRVGSADATATLTFGAYFQPVGSAHTSDADAGGSSTAFDGATTIVTEETLTIASADVPSVPGSLTLTMVASSALDADDLVILAVSIEYTRQLLTS